MHYYFGDTIAVYLWVYIFLLAWFICSLGTIAFLLLVIRSIIRRGGKFTLAEVADYIMSIHATHKQITTDAKQIEAAARKFRP